MALKKATRLWLIVFGISLPLACGLFAFTRNPGCLGAIAAAVAIFSGLLLAAFAVAALFRLVVRRIALRLAFSYFLIGVVPIPLVMALLFAVSYVLASQIISTRVRREMTAVMEAEAATQTKPAAIRVDGGRLTESSVPGMTKGDAADWARDVVSPRPLIQGNDVWFVVRPPGDVTGRLFFFPLTDPAAGFAQKVADRTGYEIRIAAGDSEESSGKFEFRPDPGPAGDMKLVGRPRIPSSGRHSVTSAEWLVGVYLERPVAVLGAKSPGKKLLAIVARTSPQVLFDQLFAQGAPEVGRIFWTVVAGIGLALLLAYLVALAIAFVLVGSIAANVNRLSRATQAIARGDFSVRVQSRARDQIGDLARSFDGMAASIQRLLVDTAEKERLQGEIDVARTIQQKLLPDTQATLGGLSLKIHFQPVAEIGGDYYDYLPMPDGRTAVALGDVSGHGLSTGLLVAMAKAALTTQIESGLSGPALFAKLNALIYRSTDSRNYMTLALFTYDAASRRGELTNAGQLAPYRIHDGEVNSVSLPSFPLGASPRADFPMTSWTLASGDLLVFLTDGLVEATNPAGEPFGFERLESLLRTQARADADHLVAALLAAVESHSGNTALEDDRTVLVISIL